VRRADNLTTILCRCHENLGTLTSWNPLGLSRPVTGLLYFTLCSICAMCAIYPITHSVSYIWSSSPFIFLCATQHEECGQAVAVCTDIQMPFLLHLHSSTATDFYSRVTNSNACFFKIRRLNAFSASFFDV